MMATPMAAQAKPAPTVDPKIHTSNLGKVQVDASFTGANLDPNETVKAYVQLKTAPVAEQQADKGRKLSAAEKSTITKSIQNSQQPVVNVVKAKGGKVEAQLQSAYNGVKVDVKRKDIAALAGVSGVAAIRPVTKQKYENAVSVPFLGAPEVWQNYGYTGKGVKVAVLDTGIDYTHADFGGPGTKEAYEAAKKNGTQPADPKWFGPNAPSVKGGIDLVGDDYSADKPAQSTPKPDPNPLDCQGHGSHVAGTIGGGGVTADGKAYRGPYNKATATKQWKVGPGVAPQADLYAVRVFGCSGSTNVTTEAIDWAVKNDMDVINMSLGSTYGPGDDTSAVAASNAAAAGVVVIASAGNSGPNPYMVGSPSTGKGVVSVAAIDSTAGYPGATLTSGSTKLNATNANNATLPTTPFNVVVLKDDPATPENEALGCSVAAYTKNGISTDANTPAQIAVTTRGTCARAARPFFGQQAGADAVVMINTNNTLPPYEGKITENPDDGTKLDVTIPFLGVKASDGAALKALEGKQLTLAAAQIDNPGFRKAASFSSGGPGGKLSNLKPGVAAPGVSTSSAAVGTGNGASIKSGTSMAAPHVSGVAALAIQAHPRWNAQEITNLLVSSSDASGLNDYRLTLEGNGLIDLKQSVLGTTYATGDSWKSNGDSFREPSLSFGFKDVGLNGVTATKKVQLVNKGNISQTFKLTNATTQQSLPASVSISPKSVTLKPGAKATVNVTMTVKQANVPGSLADPENQWNFNEVSGRIVATSATETLAVPYLMVPRAASNVAATTDGKLNRKKGPVTVSLTNGGTKQAATADFYTLGLTDDKGEATAVGINGVDLRAVGVQSIPQGDDQLLVFAVNSWNRYSNAAGLQYTVLVDTTGDGKADKAVMATDSGGVRNDDPNGLSEVFILDIASGKATASGYLTTSPTDSATVLIPVSAKDLGITEADSPRFSYTANVHYLGDSSVSDAFTGWATYNPWFKPFEDGQNLTVGPNRTVRTKLTVNQAAWNQQKPLGAMIVTFDNTAAKEPTLLLGK